MSTTPPAVHNLAQRLLASEPARAGLLDRDVDRAVRACEKLRGPLIKLTGTAGFASLMSRGLSLAKRRSPSLEALRVGLDGSLALSQEGPQHPVTADATQDAGLILLGELLALLVTLIGESLTLSLVREAWADVSIPGLNPSTKDQV